MQELEEHSMEPPMEPQGEGPGPFRNSDASLRKALGHLRDQLIDLGTRNRLIHTPINGRGARQLKIADELSDEIFKILDAGKTMTFEPLSKASAQILQIEDDDDPVYLPSDDELDDSANGLAARHIDLKLQTDLTPEPLQKRLLNISREARTLEEEQGVSVLFLALGFLHWYESSSSDVERFAPLVLFPVDLLRDKAKGRFKLVARDDEMEVNLSLSARLKNDFGLALPDLPDTADWLPSSYFQLVQQVASGQPRWRVESNTMQLGFFSFAKFRMWQDLDEGAKWPEGYGPYKNALLHKLLMHGFERGGNVTEDQGNLDSKFSDLRSLGHILDADASQAQVIAAAAEGENLVVQGPPGTGKSQTIANIIAVAAGQGKRVLFISEKRAALDVVHDRLKHTGLAPLCLELHSHKANRKHVYEDLKSTLEIARVEPRDHQDFDRAREARDELNRISSLLHQVDLQTEETAFLAMGKLSELAERGAPDAGFKIDGADRWSALEYQQRAAATQDLTQMTREHGPENSHPWRGTTKRLGATERQRFEENLDKASRSLSELQSICQGTQELTRVTPESQLSETQEAIDALRTMTQMPSGVPELIKRDEFVMHATRVRSLSEKIASLQELRRQLVEEVIDSALELHWAEARLAIATHGTSLWRFLRKDFRQALARLRGVSKTKAPGTQHERLALLDRLLDYRKLAQSVASSEEFGQSAFGGDWNRENTDIKRLMPAIEWIAEQSAVLASGQVLRYRVNQLKQITEPEVLLKKFEQCNENWRSCWERVEQALGLDPIIAFELESLTDVPLVTVLERLRVWTSDLALLDGWHRLASKAREATALGLDELRKRLADERLQPEQAENCLALIRAEAVWTRLCEKHPELESMNGDHRSQLVRRFKELDRELLELSALVVAEKHLQGLPSGSSGQIGIVRGETNKKTRHMKIRRLLSTAGDAVASVKPIFLMSPMSVAQYLDPGSLRFDLLLIDEASQVKPTDAIGAICRARQFVVVGDQKQMPPSSFFDRQTSNTDEDEELDDSDAEALAASQIGDMESILSLCDARATRSGTLRWHYRSKHESLIAVSNDEFYKNRLICPPSPESRSLDKGFSYSHVKGHFQRGRGRNPIEAEAVADAVLSHSRENPGETLGVVAMSVAQRDAIQNRLELMRTESPELDAFCVESKEGAFFVKNLENVQGDERDAIFVSIGYGRDEDGYISNNFGPVSKEGGERRLNVLFTRAKLRCRIFSSMVHSDIRIEQTKSRGARVLKRFLKYAETGNLDLPQSTGREMDSPFEEAVALALQKHGHKVTPQVGSKGFRIDLAVHDPDCEGSYILAVECDGARYHSSSWARERDRLRQAVLEGIGWKFHRIWSTDWFYNRDVELQKLLEAIDRARKTTDEAPIPRPRPRRKIERTRVNDGKPSAGPARVFYEEANFSPVGGGHQLPLHEMGPIHMKQNVLQIVDQEGPVHLMEVARRLTKLYGLGRAGNRIQDRVRGALLECIRQGDLRWDEAGENDFVATVDGRNRPPVRDRRHAAGSLRKPEMLPASEVRQAILIAAKQNVALDRQEIATEVARQFGFASTSKALSDYVLEQVKGLLANTEILEDNGRLRAARAN